MQRFYQGFSRFIREFRGFLGFLLLMLVFRSAIADWNSVPTGSMKPTIIEGDRIVVNKLAYDVKLPFSDITLWRVGEPQRGDIIVFDSVAADTRLVKRVIGLPGDTVAMQDNRLLINGQPLAYAAQQRIGEHYQLVEQLGSLQHPVWWAPEGSKASSFASVTVPLDQYLVLGDNRDNSVDSRYYGFVPRTEIVGRTRSVAMSLNYDNYYLPRRDRFFIELSAPAAP